MPTFTKITNSTGTTLNRYKLKRAGQADEIVQLEFYPSDDYVAGTAFAETPINSIIEEIEDAFDDMTTYEILQISNMAVGETTSERLDATVTSVSSSDSSKATASFVGNVVTYTAVASGNATITVNWGASKTKQVPITVV